VPDRWYRDPWLNPFQFITMATVVIKNISMLLVSGMLTSGTLRKAGDHNQITPLSSATPRAPASALLAQSQLAGLGSISISEEFVPPQQQPRGVRLKLIAQVLQEGLFYSSSDTDAPRIINTAVAEIIDSDFVPTATDFFDECREGARLLVPEMRAGYQEVRKDHLVIYSDTLQQIRQETTFPELQRRSDALVQDCVRLNRPQEQQCHTVSGLLKSGEAVSKRYNALMVGVESKTGAKFHKAPLKGLVRIAEKMALTPAPKNGQPQRVTDVVRGAIECDNFTTMMNVVRLLRSLDTDLRSEAGSTGGITDKIVVTRSKGRFGKPTSGGWADIMVNFYFEEDDVNRHVCEVQLVHSQLYTIRKNMGAHATYAIFRAALELLEMLSVDPEEGGDSELAVVAWTEDSAAAAREGYSPGDWKAETRALRVKAVAQEAEITSLKSQSEARDAEFASLNAEVASLKSQMASFLAPGLRRLE